MRAFVGFFCNFLPGLVICLLLLSFPKHGYSQVGSASLSVAIADPSGAVVTDADVVIHNVDTNQEQAARSGKLGTVTFSFLKPGHYSLAISKQQFSDIAVDNIILNVGDDRKFQLMLKVGSAAQSVTVDGTGLAINTTDGSVSTVIDSKFVENTPLNGRSFQSLILTTPGVVSNSPQRSSSLGASGEFSVNGERTESNYYTVDGVSANYGSSNNVAGGAVSGSLPGSTALGTTQALVSVDALQEFRVESSTYSAEYGRNPGGQFSMVTRSGTDKWHGTAFDYFRNDALDANSWFNDNTAPVTRKTAERQNDFGGTLGGALHIPNGFNGKDTTFFFFSYEGLRLMQPQAATINAVPTTALRQSVQGPLQQVLNAFPLPTPSAPGLGNGLGEYIGGWSNPSHLDATSVRFDHSLGPRSHLFFRFSNAPSSSVTRGTSAVGSSPSTLTNSAYLSRTYTFGLTSHIARNIDNDLRLNYSSNQSQAYATQDGIGGATSVDLHQLQGVPSASEVTVELSIGAYFPAILYAQVNSLQHQWNLVDSLNVEHRTHSLKFGIDWRRSSPSLPQPTPQVTYMFTNSASVSANAVDAGYGLSYVSAYPVYTNFSAFAQDAWRIGSRLTLSPGVRWDVNPPPGVSQGSMPYTVLDLTNYSAMTLAPQGTPLWNTTWYNFAPRLGAAYLLNEDPEYQMVMRGGGGVFFDTGQQLGSEGFNGIGFSATNDFGATFNAPASFPAPISIISPTVARPPSSPYGPIFVTSPHFQLPYAFQWNGSLEQAFGKSQSLTVSYVGTSGRKLIEETFNTVSTFNPKFSSLYLFKNGLTSNYNSLQVKYQRQVARGLQALASYTWSHALDYGSYNAAFPYQYGNSDYDVRHNLTAALSYDLPSSNISTWLHVLSSAWGIDGRFTARSGFPITLNGNNVTDPVTGIRYYSGLNIVPNTPFYLYGSRATYPGGKRINPAALSIPAAGQYGDAPRNFLRGFDAVQTDIAVRRSFPINDSLKVQFRAEAFNLPNHPNFGAVNATYGNVQFGEATAILSQSLGVLSPLYQMGGPRSLQLALKLMF